MKPLKTSLFLILSLIFYAGGAQDVRTLETKITDLLVQMPVSSYEYRDRLAEETYMLGSEGLKGICSLIVPPGTGDDIQARFAIESLSKYLGREKPSARTKEWESVCIGFVHGSKDRFVRAFFIRQLQWMGSSATVDALASYLGDEFLCHPAISAMMQADPQKAGVVFAREAGSLPGVSKIEAVKAIGDLRVMDANQMLMDMLAENNETDLQRNVLRALARIGHPESCKSLSDAAKASRYMPDPTAATMSLLEYAGTLAENGNKELGNKICQQLMKRCKTPSQAHFKSYALAIYADNTGISDALPMLVLAMKDKNKPYRMSAIQYAIENKSPSGPWIKELSATKDGEVRVEILYLLASLKDISTVSAILPLLDSKDARVRNEAVSTLASVRGLSAINDIVLHMLKYPEEEDILTSKNALLSIAGARDLKPVTDHIREAPDPVKAALLEVLAAKGNPDHFGILLEYARNEDATVRLAAIRGLKRTAAGKDLDSLLQFLVESQDSLATPEIHQAIIAAALHPDNRSAKTEGVKKVLTAMENAGDKGVFIPLLAGIGGPQSLDRVTGFYYQSTGNQRALALNALMDWPDSSSIPELYEICESTGSAHAFKGCVKLVESSNHTPDQKLLLFRKMMPLAGSDDQKSLIIAACGNVKTFLSLIFVSGYLEDDALGPQAADAAIKIALPTPGKDDGLYGDVVRAVLIKAKEVLSGPESQYTRIDVDSYLESMPDDPGFISIFNGKDLSGWQGLVENPLARAQMDRKKLAVKQAGANELMQTNWSVRNGMLVFTGSGFDNICTIKEYGDIEMIVDWRIGKKGDSGIYLRGSPQVQIWDTSRVESGAQVGSGGLYNNKTNPAKPLKVADNVIPDWNTFRITMIGEQVSVYLNGILVTDQVVMENYWDRSLPIFSEGPIELQAHGTDIAFRDVYVREIHGATLAPGEEKDGFVLLFNGKNLDGWTGNKVSHVVEEGTIAIRPEMGGHGNLYTEKEYADFILRLDFKLTPGANNGLGIRAPLEGDAAYVGMEFQVLDNTAPVYANLKPYQYHGSVYGVIPAKRGYLRPVGEWNEQEVIVDGTKIKIILNGATIVDGDISGPIRNGTLDGKDHPGLSRTTGHIGFLGHGSTLWYRNLRIKELHVE